MVDVELDGLKRLTLFQVLPQEVGSLEESLLTKKIRERLLSESFKDAVSWEERMGQVNFDIEALQEYPTEQFNFSEDEAEVIAWGFLYDEQEDSVSTDDAYIELYEVFRDKVKELKDE